MHCIAENLFYILYYSIKLVGAVACINDCLTISI